MDDFKTERSTFSPIDFQIWQERGILDITPKFQRRPVWRPKARSYFIDTMLREMTVPPLYLRKVQNESKTKELRQVVDGQQRIRSVLDFMSSDGFRLSKTLKAPWAGKKFGELPPEQQKQLEGFSFPCEIFKGISDAQILEVFCRLNMNGIPLNKQELRNGKYFGAFKQTSYALAHSHLEFWRKHKIFTELNIARMLEVELTSELLIAGNTGMQDKKNTIDSFYEKWEDSYPECDRDERRFKDTLTTIAESFTNGDLASTDFKRAPLFYTLYCVVYHRTFGLPGIQRSSPKKKLTSDDRDSLREAVIHLSDVLAEAHEPEGEVPKKYTAFITSTERQTDNIDPRKIRFNSLYDAAF